MESNEELKAAYLEVVENQLRENDPPETRQTFERLCGEGFTEKNAKILIASVIAYETYEDVRSSSPFNHARFVKHLSLLPDQSFPND